MTKFIVEYTQRSPFTGKIMANQKRVIAADAESAVKQFWQLRIDHIAVVGVWERVMGRKSILSPIDK